MFCFCFHTICEVFRSLPHRSISQPTVFLFSFPPITVQFCWTQVHGLNYTYVPAFQFIYTRQTILTNRNTISSFVCSATPTSGLFHTDSSCPYRLLHSSSSTQFVPSLLCCCIPYRLLSFLPTALLLFLLSPAPFLTDCSASVLPLPPDDMTLLLPPLTIWGINCWAGGWIGIAPFKRTTSLLPN